MPLRKRWISRSKARSPVVKCPGCGSEHPCESLGKQLYVCSACNRYLPMPSKARIAMLADSGSFSEFDRALVSRDPLHFMSYRQRLKEARKLSGVREAITTGVCRIQGQPAVLMVFDFAFLGGTMGSVVGEKIAHAFEEATRRRLPVVSVTATGGARVQEGMLSLMQMAKVSAAASRHDREGLAFISILADPTFGGVTASFASLGDVIIGEPGAQIGFVGPRVIEDTTGVKPPQDSHHAETLLRAGLIDLVVPRRDLRGAVAYLVARLRPQRPAQNGHPPVPQAPTDDREAAWQEVVLARHAARPAARHYISRMCTQFLELHGDRWGGDDPVIVGGLAELDGQTVMFVAQDRGDGSEPAVATAGGGMARPGGYRKARRLMQLAAKFGHPIVTLVDCPNAQPSWESEHSGIAHALASNLATMSSLPTPVIAVIIGQGGSGGAVALAVADRVLMQQHAIYSVISPEGAASILFRDVERAEVLAEALKLTARDLLSLGIIDAVVPEPKGGAHADPDAAAATLLTYLRAALYEVCAAPPEQLVAMRYERYRRIGRVGVDWRRLAGGALRRAASYFRRLALRDRRRSPRPSVGLPARTALPAPVRRSAGRGAKPPAPLEPEPRLPQA